MAELLPSDGAKEKAPTAEHWVWGQRPAELGRMIFSKS